MRQGREWAVVLRVKRVYEPASPSDGIRVLVDRLWPRGLARERLEGIWMKEVAPSTGLRQWYHRDPTRWELFQERYRQELLTGPGDQLLDLAGKSAQGPVTLLTASRRTPNHAQVLAQVIQELLDPPSKAALRRQLRSWREGLAPEEAAARSREIRAVLTGLVAWQEAQGVLLYFSVGREVETRSLAQLTLQAGKALFAPKVDRARHQLLVGRVEDLRQDLVPGPFQAIPEPREGCSPTEAAPLIDLVLVPGLAFDRFGQRVGYGAGYYDRLLAGLPPGTPRLGLLYAGQLVPRCPATPTDQPLDGLVCEIGLLSPWPKAL